MRTANVHRDIVFTWGVWYYEDGHFVKVTSHEFAWLARLSGWAWAKGFGSSQRDWSY